MQEPTETPDASPEESTEGEVSLAEPEGSGETAPSVDTAAQWIPATMRAIGTEQPPTAAAAVAEDQVESEPSSEPANVWHASAPEPPPDVPKSPKQLKSLKSPEVLKAPDASVPPLVTEPSDRIAAVQAELEGLGGRLAGIETRLEETDKRLDFTVGRLAQRHAEGDGRLKELEEALDGNSWALDGLGRAQAELAERQAETLTALSNDRRELRREVQAEIDALRGALATQGSGLDETVEAIQGLQAGVIEKQTQGLAEIRQLLDGLAAQELRIESLELSRSEESDRRLEHEREIEKERSGVIEKLTAIESRVAAESDRAGSRGDSEERARRVSEERTSAVLSELRERLQIQSERLTESEEGVRERVAEWTRRLDATVAGVRVEIDEANKLADPIRGDLSALTDAVTAQLAEFGVRLSDLQNATPLRNAEPVAISPRPIATSLDSASFEDLRAVGLSVTQAARFIAYRNTLERPLAAADIDRVAGLQDELREALKRMLTD